MNGPVELWALTERFATETEALQRLRQLQCRNPAQPFLMRDHHGRALLGLPLQIEVHNNSAGDLT
jgi:hypothetical protein